LLSEERNGKSLPEEKRRSIRMQKMKQGRATVKDWERKAKDQYDQVKKEGTLNEEGNKKLEAHP